MKRPPHRLLTAVAVAVLLVPLAGCSAASTAVEACLGKQADGATAGELAGRYVGEADAEGVAITLMASEREPGSGTFTVRNWPTGDWYRSELGDAFDGSGTWSVQSAQVHLSVTAPERFLHGDTLDALSIAEDGSRLSLYEDDDPDVCPAFRLRKQSR